MFADILKQLRQRKSLNQKQLASAIFVSPSTISQYESGRIMPSHENMERLAEYFNVSTSYLLGESQAADLEDLMNQMYYGDLTVGAFLRECLKVDETERSVVIKLINALSSNL